MRISVVFLAAAALAAMTASAAFGGDFQPGDTVGPGDPVRLCHSLGGGAFVSVTVPAQLAFRHAGPSHQGGADIIPPFTFEDNQGNIDDSLSSGQNWNAEGQATWANGCVAPPPPPPPPSPPAAPQPPAAPPPPVVGGVAGGVFTSPTTCGSIRLGIRQLRVGQRTVLRVVVRDRNGRPLPGWRVTVAGDGIRASVKTGAKGIARVAVRPRKRGVVRISAGTGLCSKRISVLGVPFQPPLTG